MSKSRQAAGSLYDAVAGRIAENGFLPTTKSSSGRGPPLPPEEVLYRRAGAPIRYAEDDEYFQDRHLKQKLPDSDLLKIIHAYVSDFYARTSEDNVDEKSLDETALLAIGMLLEEATAKLLGKTGYLALLDPERPNSNP